MNKIKESLAKLYFLLAVAVMPFYYENGYLNLSYAKAKFLWLTGSGILLILFLSYLKHIPEIYIKAKAVFKEKKYKNIVKSISILDIAVILFSSIKS